MTFDRRVLAGALAILLLAAACGGGATQAPGATPEPGATQEPSDTQEPSNTDEPDVSLTPGGAPDLEAKLPLEVNGVKFERTSFDGNDFPGGLPIGDSDMEAFLADNGKSVNDVSVAIATASESDSAGTFVMAIRIKGVPSDKMLAWAADTMGQDTTKTTVGGKEVYGQGLGGMAAYLYVKDDTVYYIFAIGSDALAEGLVAQLP
jgi:hypothetical protein